MKTNYVQHRQTRKLEKLPNIFKVNTVLCVLNGHVIRGNWMNKLIQNESINRKESNESKHLTTVSSKMKYLHRYEHRVMHGKPRDSKNLGKKAHPFTSTQRISITMGHMDLQALIEVFLVALMLGQASAETNEKRDRWWRDSVTDFHLPLTTAHQISSTEGSRILY